MNGIEKRVFGKNESLCCYKSALKKEIGRKTAKICQIEFKKPFSRSKKAKTNVSKTNLQ